MRNSCQFQDNFPSLKTTTCATQGADRALLVDVQNERIHLQNLTRLQEQQEAGVASRHPHNVSLSSTDTMPSLNQDSRASPQPPAGASGGVSSSKLTVRAMPDPDSSFNTDRLESLQSAEHIRLVGEEVNCI